MSKPKEGAPTKRIWEMTDDNISEELLRLRLSERHQETEQIDSSLDTVINLEEGKDYIEKKDEQPKKLLK